MIERGKVPAWLLLAAGLGVANNAFGIVQLANFVTRTHEGLMMKRMSAQAVDLCYGLPLWMKVASALGSIGGVVGSVLPDPRRSAAMTVLAISLAGYDALSVGD